MKPKQCRLCGNTIPFYTPNGKKKNELQYARATYCGQECSRLANKTIKWQKSTFEGGLEHKRLYKEDVEKLIR